MQKGDSKLFPSIQSRGCEGGLLWFSPLARPVPLNLRFSPKLLLFLSEKQSKKKESGQGIRFLLKEWLCGVSRGYAGQERSLKSSCRSLCLHIDFLLTIHLCICVSQVTLTCLVNLTGKNYHPQLADPKDTDGEIQVPF